MFWRKMPAHQLALAAERQALRKSFGHQRDDLRLLDVRYLQTKAMQLLRAAAPPEHPLIESEAQRQEALFGHDEPEPIEGEIEQEPPAESDPREEESRRADLVLGMVAAYATTYHLTEMAARKAIAAKALLKYGRRRGRGLEDLTGPELEWLAAKLSERVTEAAQKPAGE